MLAEGECGLVFIFNRLIFYISVHAFLNVAVVVDLSCVCLFVEVCVLSLV